MTQNDAKFPEAAMRFLVPSVRDIIFIFIFSSVLAGTLSTRSLADPDIGWHIRTGERILITATLPRTDPYSSLMQGHPWFAWEWLYDVLVGILHRFCGLNGVVWLCALIVASTFTLLLSQLLRRGTGLFLAVVLMLLAECASVIHLFARPHIVSWLFVLLWFIALEQWGANPLPRWLPWFFPVSMLFWVNLHGGWIFGLALLAIYVFSAVVEIWRASDAFLAVRISLRARKMAWSWVASALATFANPYGWSLHAHIYRYLTDRYLMNRIVEFGSPNFHYWPQRCFAFILVLALFALVSRRRSVPVSHLLVVMFAAYSGLYSSRNLPISSMLLVLVAGPVLWEAFAALPAQAAAWQWTRNRVAALTEFSARMATQEMRFSGSLWPIVSVIVSLLLCLHGGRVGSRQLLHADFDPKAVPAAAVDFLSSQPRHDPVFSTDTWGGYLIYRLYPQRLVVVDDRHDLYGSARFRQILILMQGEPGWRDVLDNLHVHTVLLPAGSTLSSLLRQLPLDWRVTYEDKVAVVFETRPR